MSVTSNIDPIIKTNTTMYAIFEKMMDATTFIDNNTELKIVNHTIHSLAIIDVI